MTEPANSAIHTAGPLMQERSNTPDMLRMVKQRARQASEYYHHVGLVNGGLRRESVELALANKRWSGSHDKNNDSNELCPVVTITARSQPTTPVRPHPNKIGQSWMKPHKHGDSTDEDDGGSSANSKALTFPRKIRGQDRVSSSKKRSPRPTVAHVFPTGQSCNVTDTIAIPNQPASSERYHTVPRRTDDAQKHSGSSVDAKESRVDFSPSKHTDHNQNDYRDPSSDYTIVYTLPNVRPRKQAPRERVHYYEQIELPPNKERSKGSHQSYKTGSAGSSPSKSPLFHSRLASDAPRMSPSHSLHSPSHTNSTGLQRSPHSGSHSAHSGNSEVNAFRRNKHHTISGSASPEKLSGTESGTPNSRGSPVPYRRLKIKSRSKSDILETQHAINDLQDIDSEKDAQKFYERHFVISPEQARKRRHNFAHYDWQSMLFSFDDVFLAMDTLKRKNTPTGASKAAALAAAPSSDSLGSKLSSTNGSQEDISLTDGETALHHNRANEMVASCAYFRNELGGESERIVSESASSSLLVQVRDQNHSGTTQAQSTLTNHSYLSIVEHGTSGLLPPNSPPSDSIRFGVECLDGGALYYRTYFYEKEHQNLFGVDDTYGPIVISFKREKIEDSNGGSFYQYRIIVRTSELCTLRGSILEDIMSMTLSRHPPNKGFSAKDVIEFLYPEIHMSCMKVALATPKVQDQIMKVDEHNMQSNYKVGVLYCKAGQVTEEEMYNNEHGSKAFDQFLNLLGKKVKLNGFVDYKGGLDVATDSTGTDSVFTTFNGNKIMFHVSTLLPFSATNKQQLLRKRHIGNDIVTIVFQEPGSVPFNPQNMRSHFQHVFIIVRVHNPCKGNTFYSVAVTRSRNIPRFGPPIPQDSMFPLSATFREFLLTKVINGENTAHAAGKFKALAMNTREQYLRDLAQNYGNQGAVEGTPRFARFSITSSRKNRDNKDKQKPKLMPEMLSMGGLTWEVSVNDYSKFEMVSCILGISDCVFCIIERDTRKLIFSIPCQAVLGWSVPPPTLEYMNSYERDLHIFYGRGERVSIHTYDVDSRDEMIRRLERFTKGSETVHRQLRRDLLHGLGFNVNYQGIVMEVDASGFAAEDGLKQSSRLVEICKVSVATMTHVEILDLLRTSDRVTVVIIPPNDDGTPRKCSMELYHLCPVLETCAVDMKTVVSPVYEVDQKRNEILHKTLSMKDERKFRENEDSHKDHHPDAHSKGQSFKNYVIKKPSLERKTSGNKTQATLIATATKLAMVGFTAAAYTKPTNPKDPNDASSLSSAYNTMSSTKSTSSNQSGYSGAEVEWTEGSADVLDVNRFTESVTGMNSNHNNNTNNSNHLHSSQHRGPNVDIVDINALRNKEKRKPIVYQQFNENKDTFHPPCTIPQSPSKRPRNHCSLNHGKQTTALEKQVVEKSKISLSLNSHPLTSSYVTSRSQFHSTSKPATALTSHSASDVFNRSASNAGSTRPIPRADRVGPKLKSSIRDRGSSSGGESIDVQSSLIQLISGSPKKSHCPRKSPSRSASERFSPKRRLSPSSFKLPVFRFYRSASHESLSPSKAESKTRHDDSDTWTPYEQDEGFFWSPGMPSRVSDVAKDGEISSTLARPLPVPVTTDWTSLLDAAKAAEAFEASSIQSISTDSSNEISNFTLELPRSPKRSNKRTVLVDQFCDQDSCHNTDSLLASRSAVPRVVDGPCADIEKLNESDLRLEKIEKEMRFLQDTLQQEHKSKMKLEAEVSSLRQDNSRLLHKVRISNTELLNGVKRSARKPIKS